MTLQIFHSKMEFLQVNIIYSNDPSKYICRFFFCETNYTIKCVNYKLDKVIITIGDPSNYKFNAAV